MKYRIKHVVSRSVGYEYIVQRKWWRFWITEWSYGNSAGVRCWGTELRSEDEAKAWLETVIAYHSHEDEIVYSKVA